MVILLPSLSPFAIQIKASQFNIKHFFPLMFTNSSIQLSDETKMEVDNNEFTSISTLNSIDDIFKDFDLDACLVNDGLPL